MRRFLRAAAVLVIAGTTSAALAQSPDDPSPDAAAAALPRASRVHVHVLFGLGAAGQDITEDRTFREFAEDGSLNVDYGAGTGPSFEAGLRYALNRRFSLGLAFALGNRKNDARYEVRLPHPLYLGRHREATGDASGLPHREMAGHLDLVYTLAAGRLGARIHAGPSMVGVRSSLLRTVQYEHAYPFDTVRVTSAPLGSFTSSGIGGSVGGGLSYAIGRRASLLGQARFTRATVTLVPAEGNQAEVKAGGLTAGAGLLLGF